MKIAYCRFNQNTDLDFTIASTASRNTEERIGVLEAMVELGHDVTIVSFVSASHMHVFKGECATTQFDNTWMKKLRYNLDPDMQQFDMMIVETSTTNTMFGYGSGANHTSFIQHFADLLKKSKGLPIMIFHVGMQNLSLPLYRMTMDPNISDEERDALSPINYRNIFKDINIWDYDWHLWSKAYSKKAFMKAFSKTYGRKDYHISSHVNTPIGYSKRYDKAIRPRRSKPEYDLVYVGRCDNLWRRQRIHTMYDDSRYKSLLVGKGWDNEQWLNAASITTPGQTKNHGDVQSHYKKGIGCVLCLDPELADAGMSTTRHIQSIRSGCVTMADHKILGADKWVGSEYLVSSADDVYEILQACEQSQDFYVDSVEYQRSLLVQWIDIIPEVVK